jgi:hypothetical protein
MTPDELIEARKAYSYVPARLIESSSAAVDLIWQELRLIRRLPSHAEWNSPAGKSKYSSVGLDAFHTKLLNGDDDDDLLHGLLSTVFWGYASGTNGRFRIPFAIKRANFHVAGKNGQRRISIPQTRVDILQCLRAARTSLRSGEIREALSQAMSIKFLDMSFASKVLTFMDPSKAAVYDRVIGRRLAANPDARLQAMAVTSPSTSRVRKAEAYKQWCGYCVENASEMNEAGHRWTDWDNSEHAWRAVDIERAFFAQE